MQKYSNKKKKKIFFKNCVKRWDFFCLVGWMHGLVIDRVSLWLYCVTDNNNKKKKKKKKKK